MSDDDRPTARGESIPSSVDDEAPATVDGGLETALEEIEERVAYLESKTPRDRAHADVLEARIRELELLRQRLVYDD